MDLSAIPLRRAGWRWPSTWRRWRRSARGRSARRRVLAEQTYDHRGAQLDALLDNGVMRFTPRLQLS